MVDRVTTNARLYQIFSPRLLWAVYQEVGTHLRQLAGVDAQLLPRRSQTFDYRQSQVRSLTLTCTDQADLTSRYRVDQVERRPSLHLF